MQSPQPPSNQLKLSKKGLESLWSAIVRQAQTHKVSPEQFLSALLDQFYSKLSQDLLVGFFFTGKDLKKIAFQQGRFLMRAFGAVPDYTGLAPSAAHSSLPPILTGHFDRRLRVLENLLKELGFQKHEIELWINFESSFRKGIEK